LIRLKIHFRVKIINEFIKILFKFIEKIQLFLKLNLFIFQSSFFSCFNQRIIIFQFFSSELNSHNHFIDKLIYLIKYFNFVSV